MSTEQNTIIEMHCTKGHQIDKLSANCTKEYNYNNNKLPVLAQALQLLYLYTSHQEAFQTSSVGFDQKMCRSSVCPQIAQKMQ